LGQKVSPIGLRIGIVEDWRSRWYVKPKEYSEKVYEDLIIRDYLSKKLERSGVSKIDIERIGTKITINIFSARSALIIGKKGKKIDQLRDDLLKLINKKTKNELQINIIPVNQPDLDAALVAERIAAQIEKRVAFRRAMKKAIETTMKCGAKGIKVSCSGRLAGAEMARTEWYLKGRVPLHTLRAKIDYGLAEAHTKFGKIGIKVWIFLDEIYDKNELEKYEKNSEKNI